MIQSIILRLVPGLLQSSILHLPPRHPRSTRKLAGNSILTTNTFRFKQEGIDRKTPFHDYFLYNFVFSSAGLWFLPKSCPRVPRQDGTVN